MTDYKIKVKDIIEQNNQLIIELGIYDNDLPETTITERPVLDENGEVLEPETTKEIVVPRPELHRSITIPFDQSEENMENQIKKELEMYKKLKIYKEDKISKFKGKVY